MRIVVFSDSHGDYSALHRIVLSQPDAALFLHLGDGEEEFEILRSQHPEKAMLGVAGNNDWGSKNQKQRLLTVEGKRVFFTHGHLHRGEEGVLRAAAGQGADIALWGHSHRARAEYREGMYLMNPGSVSRPRDGMPSYGFVDLTPAGIVTKIVPLDRAFWR